MRTILLIGNSRGKVNVSDGGSIKVNLYKSCLEECGNNVILIDLYKWKRRFVRILFGLIKNIKKSDVILIMGGPKGSRLIIPIVARLNKKYRKRTVYCPLGTGTIENATKSLDKQQLIDFVNCANFFNICDLKMGKWLSQLSSVIPQNKTLSKLYREFYGLNNVETLQNFRDVEIKRRDFKSHTPFKMIFLSRVASEKGVIMLMEAVSEIGDISLDIYGQMQLNKQDHQYFDKLIRHNANIAYKGISDFQNSISLLSEYDLFCLPTMYKGEGTSGAFIESLIAGTPVLLSSYSQARELVDDNINGFIFEIGNKNDLIKRIKEIKKTDLTIISANSQKSAEKYTFSFNKDRFIRVILGDK